MNKAVAEGPFADFGSISIGSVINQGTQSVCSGENESRDGSKVADLYKRAEQRDRLAPNAGATFTFLFETFHSRQDMHILAMWASWDSLGWLQDYN